MARSITAIALLAAALPLAAQASTASQQAAAVNHEPLQVNSQVADASASRTFDNDAFRYSGMSVAMADSQRAVNANDRAADQADDERSWLEILSDNNRHLGAPAGW
ncbi:hypothetical protein C8E00_104260 [Chromohalobacter marismortui]|uniref:Uncharacterized protein n=1 Tax=Chromohalobacter marismortui TaxID=42055 RepID=A0A4R7NP03_9GAMM|nr:MULTISPECIES: hypothetical protein [Chromohalobacter]MCI0509858.1 hypothetical protein [Chromohalobacter sp.]MCI0591864.1 hypothetical protein [Chromohalobacter sp.]TDU22080.1 hypothetical protein C8E00_104260 [Chromohalobacter marismortui]